MSAIGMGSQLVYRAREAMMRAQTARVLGITKPSVQTTAGVTSMVTDGPVQGSATPITNTQPYQAPKLEPKEQDKAYAEVDAFLAGLTLKPKPEVPLTQSIGTGPQGQPV